MWKVINKNAVVNEEKNIAIDNVFFFNTIEAAHEYINACNMFCEFGKKRSKNDIREQVLLECTKEEEEKYGFDQYNEEYNPTDLKVPNIMIERPIVVQVGVPYWVTTRELCVYNAT